MYYVYILYSEKSEMYYVGYTEDYERRYAEHNHSPHNTFTSKHRPWILVSVFEVKSEIEAIRAERFIKKQKSKTLLLKLITPSFVPTGVLAGLVRVPQMRD